MLQLARPSLLRIAGPALVLSLGLGTALRAEATLSIVAVDRSQGDLGALAISCIGDELALSEIMRLDPSVGAVVAQSYFNSAARDEMMSQLVGGATPDEAINAVLDPAFDPPGPRSGGSYRQYAVLDLEGQVFVHTGVDSIPWAGHKTAQVGDFVIAAQGNALTGQAVLDAISEGFQKDKGTLDQRLVAALQAVIDAGGGDERCAPHPADAGAFEVRRAGEEPVSASVVTKDESSAAALLAEMRRLLPQPQPQAGPPQDEGPSDANHSEETAKGCSFDPAHPQGMLPLFWLFAALAYAARSRRARLAPRGAPRG